MENYFQKIIYFYLFSTVLVATHYAVAMASFAYAGVDIELRQMAKELESLGGGDACLSRFEVIAVVDDADKHGDSQSENDGQILWPLKSSIGLRNIALPKSASKASSMKYFPVTDCIKFSDLLGNTAEEPCRHVR